VSPRFPLDLEEKFLRASKYRGPKLFLGFAACPTGWMFDPAYTPDVARLAVECGLWPLKEAVDGKVVHTYLPKLSPVDDYLKLQGRFRHLFEPTVQADAIGHIQHRVTAYWEQVKQAEQKA
jgi:pyruvate ferredoxin oxidoreductase beta subunit